MPETRRRGYHAEIAVAGLGRMYEIGRRPGTGQRRGDLAGDMTGLAHTTHDDATTAGQDALDGTGKVIIDTSLKGTDGSRFNVQRLLSQLLGTLSGKIGGGRSWFHDKAASIIMQVYLTSRSPL